MELSLESDFDFQEPFLSDYSTIKSVSIVFFFDLRDIILLQIRKGFHSHVMMLLSGTRVPELV